LFAVGSDFQTTTPLPEELYPPPSTLFPAEQVTVIGLLLPLTLTDVERFS
jgi:hypothetical protein